MLKSAEAQALKTCPRLFNAQKKSLREPEILRIFRRLADLRNCFRNQCARWLRKHVPAALVAGNG
jgi:hypothetical protein